MDSGSIPVESIRIQQNWSIPAGICRASKSTDLKDTVISSRPYTAQQEGQLTHGRSMWSWGKCKAFQLLDCFWMSWCFVLLWGLPCLATAGGHSLSLEPFRQLIGIILWGKEVLCVLDFGWSCVRNGGFVGLKKLTQTRVECYRRVFSKKLKMWQDLNMEVHARQIIVSGGCVMAANFGG